jgi:hypothetical protein
MTGGWVLRAIRGQAPEGAGVALGAWAGLGLWLSPEIMPLDLMAFGALWLAWLIIPDRRDIARLICQVAGTVLLVAGCALAVDPPYAAYGSVELDRISIIYIVLALICCALALAAVLIERARPAWGTRLVLGLVLPIAGLGMWVALYPNLLRGPDGVMSAANAHVFHTIIAEMQPVRSVATAIQYLLTGSVAATMLLWFALRRRSLLILYAALCGWALVALGAMHLRFAAYPSAAGAVLLPVLVTALSTSLARRPERVRIIARLAVVAPLLMALRAGIVPGLTSTAKAADGHALPNCRISGLGPLLAPYSGQVMLANVGDTPELLYRTELRTVGSLYLRGIPAFLRLRAAWRSMPSEGIPDAVQQTGATLVLACPSGDRSPLVLDLPPETLADRLSRGDIPPWLEKVAEDKASGNVLYRVIQ